MDPTTRFYLVLTAAMAALGAVLSFTLVWELRDRSPRGNTRVDGGFGAPPPWPGAAPGWNGAPFVPQPPNLPAPPANDVGFRG